MNGRRPQILLMYRLLGTLMIFPARVDAAANHAPVITIPSNQTATPGTLLAIFVTADDLDGDALSFSVTGHPPGATFLPLGDVTGNGSLSALDAAYVLQANVGLRSLTEEELQRADVTRNGTVSALDAAKILQMKVGMIPPFNTYLLQWRPTPVHATTTYTVTFTVADAGGLADVKSLTITVPPDTTPPVIQFTSPKDGDMIIAPTP